MVAEEAQTRKEIEQNKFDLLPMDISDNTQNDNAPFDPVTHQVPEEPMEIDQDVS